MGDMLRTIVSVKNHSWIKPYVLKNKKLLFLVIFLGVGTFFSAAALMFTSGYLISKSSTQPENILMVYVPIVLVRAFGISRPIFRYVERLAGHNMILKMLSSMRVRLYQLLEPKALDFKSKYKTGDLLGVMAEDIEHLQDLYLKTVFPTLVSLTMYVIAVIGLGFFSIPFALVMAVLLFVLVVLFPLVSLLVTSNRNTQIKQGRNKLYQTLTDAVMGIGDWMISGRQADFIARYEADETCVEREEALNNRFNRKRNFLFQVAVLILAIVMLVWVAMSADAGLFDNVWIAAFVLVVFPLIDAFSPIPAAVSQLPSYQNSLQRISELNEDEQVKREYATEEQINELCGNKTLDVVFTNVSFSYGDGKTVLDQLSLTIQKGEKVALLGKSGAGKSTLGKLLLGAYTPSNGNVTINGIQIAELKPFMSKFVAVLNQKPHLFDTTVMNNIRLGNPEASDEAVYDAAKKAQLHSFITSLPRGYETPVHELGGRFSGGERQRIALARILLQKAPILVLDEPTVGLDPITERNLLKTIFENVEGQTLIWITHHLIGVEQMDRVVFLEEGRIKMAGSHEQLLSSNDRYQHLYKLDMPI